MMKKILFLSITANFSLLVSSFLIPYPDERNSILKINITCQRNLQLPSTVSSRQYGDHKGNFVSYMQVLCSKGTFPMIKQHSEAYMRQIYFPEVQSSHEGECIFHGPMDVIVNGHQMKKYFIFISMLWSDGYPGWEEKDCFLYGGSPQGTTSEPTRYTIIKPTTRTSTWGPGTTSRWATGSTSEGTTDTGGTSKGTTKGPGVSSEGTTGGPGGTSKGTTESASKGTIGGPGGTSNGTSGGTSIGTTGGPGGASKETPGPKAASEERPGLEGASKETPAPVPEGASEETRGPEGASKETPGPEGASKVTPGPEGASKETPSPEGASKETPSPEGASEETPGPEGAREETPGSEGASKETPSPEGASKETPGPEGAREERPGPEGASEERPGPEGASKETPSPEGASEETPSPEGASKETPSPEGASEETPSPEGASEETPSPEGASEETPSPEGASKETPSPEGASEETPSPEGASEERPGPEGASEERPGPEGASEETPGASEATSGPKGTSEATPDPELTTQKGGSGKSQGSDNENSETYPGFNDSGGSIIAPDPYISVTANCDDVENRNGSGEIYFSTLHLVTDVHMSAIGQCKNNSIVSFETNDFVNYYLKVYYKQSYADPEKEGICFFDRSSRMEYQLRVEVSWGERYDRIHTFHKTFTITCLFTNATDRIDQTSVQSSIKEGFMNFRDVEGTSHFDTKSIISLRIVNILGKPLGTPTIALGRTIRLRADSDGGSGELGISPVSCDVIGVYTNQRYGILRAGCGDGVIIPKNKGFITTDCTVLSPYFTTFALSIDTRLRFECNFTMCESKCDGTSCHEEE